MNICSRRVHVVLPIFRVRVADREFVYAPGFAVELDAVDLDAIESALTEHADRRAVGPKWVDVLIRRARHAQDAWEKLADERFEPKCLTLYLSNDCQLACRYCFAAPARLSRPSLPSRAPAAADRILSLQQVRNGAEAVVSHCRAHGQPLTVVMHGGGEPTLHWTLLQQAVAVTRAVAAAHDLKWWGYVATHGAISEAKARWLAREFDEIGLSCDGPPELQDAQRPSAGGKSTSGAVVRTAQLLAAEGASFSVRATVTAGNAHRLPEIARWLHDELGALRIRVEPAYLSAAASDTLEVDAFAAAFWQAREWARSRGAEVETSGVRMDEVHGPYCNPLRHVLQLVPGGGASACFVATGALTARELELQISKSPPAGVTYRPDEQRVSDLRRQALYRSPYCGQCFNVYHCTGDCPDVCSMLSNGIELRGSRCQLNRQLGARQLMERATVCASIYGSG